MTGLYIHIPFCRQKCGYCDFTSFADKEHMADKYIEALCREAREYRGTNVDTIFLGGGTPTVLTSEQLYKIASICREYFDVEKDCEFTIEANPGTLDDKKITAILESGINRISVGVQSFCDEELREIGRIHDAETAYNTICHLKNMGFDNINIDLMTALPSQTEDNLKSTIKTALSLPVTHISAYSLIIEEGTPLERDYREGKLTLPDEAADRRMYADVVNTLKSNGFNQYEISNFAKKGYECRHNIKYWTGGKYIGLGVAAHSYDGEKRYFNTDGLEDYINGAKRGVTELTENDKISEFIITGLRMTDGINEKVFFERFGVRLADLYGDALNKFTDMGLLTYNNGFYAFTPRGIDVSNTVLCEFV